MSLLDRILGRQPKTQTQSSGVPLAQWFTRLVPNIVPAHSGVPVQLKADWQARHDWHMPYQIARPQTIILANKAMFDGANSIPASTPRQ